jgi:hypothetical protein
LHDKGAKLPEQAARQFLFLRFSRITKSPVSSDDLLLPEFGRVK